MDCSLSFTARLQQIYHGTRTGRILWYKKTSCDFSSNELIFFAKNRPTCLWMSGIPLTWGKVKKASCSPWHPSHRLAEAQHSKQELKAKFLFTVYLKACPSLSTSISQLFHCSWNYLDTFSGQRWHNRRIQILLFLSQLYDSGQAPTSSCGSFHLCKILVRSWFSGTLRRLKLSKCKAVFSNSNVNQSESG